MSAPRYARPVPTSRLAPLTTPLPHHRPKRQRAARAVMAFIISDDAVRVAVAALGIFGVITVATIG